MVTALIFTIIGLGISMVLFLQSCIKLSDDYSWVPSLVLSAILMIATFTSLIIITDEVNSPNAEDVIKGKAVYQENYHVIKSDTIKTYTIVWDKK